MAVVRFILTAAFMVLGLFVCCVGVYGVFKLKYAANRMHAAALNDTHQPVSGRFGNQRAGCLYGIENSAGGGFPVACVAGCQPSALPLGG